MAISQCRHGGFHAYMAGPCFNSVERAQAYQDKLDAHGLIWKPQDAPWPTTPTTPEERTYA